MNRLKNLFAVPELRKRVLFTLILLVIYRLGVHVSVPGVNAENLQAALRRGGGGLFDVVDLFSGGAFKKFSVFALGIAPYITASIVLQLMGAVVPYLDNLQKKEGEAGRQKINEWTRYLTVGLAFIQGFGIASLAQSQNQPGLEVVVSTLSPTGFRLLAAFSLAVGSIFVMWLGEQITERGVGNGISLLIFAGIVAGLPQGITTLSVMMSQSLRNAPNVPPPGIFLLLLAAMTAMLLAVVLVESAYRRIPIHYARRADSAGMSSQRSSYMPLKLNTAGVMPVIFASSVICSPIHMTKTEPTAREKAASRRNPVGDRLEVTTSRPGWFWLWASDAMPNPCAKANATVRYRVHWLIFSRPASPSFFWRLSR